MFVVIGTAPVMEARLVTRTGEDSWLSEPLFETRIDPLVQAVGAVPFSVLKSGPGGLSTPFSGVLTQIRRFLTIPVAVSSPLEPGSVGDIH